MPKDYPLPAQDDARHTGVIKRMVTDKGFGFVRDDQTGLEYFFHRSGAANFDALQEGTAVEFRAGTGPKGPRAEDVESRQ
jgi:CspA family cold shock protein